MNSEDGEFFVKQLASFVRTHEKSLANALQFRRQSNPVSHGASRSISALPTRSPTSPASDRPSTSSSSSTSNTLAAAFSLGSLSFASQNLKPAKLALTPHHLFYLLSRFQEMGINVGPMKIRLENLHDTSTSTNYVSFLDPSQRAQSRGSDVVSIRSVSSVRSVMSGMSALWASFGIGSSISAARTEKQKAAVMADLRYLYSAFTKIPCLRLAPDWRARLIRGYEEFPFDSAVPLYVFKNLQALEISGIDFRQFFGWDRLADQIRSLSLKRASIDDPADILIDIVLDDMDKRRRRTSKTQVSPIHTHTHTSSSPRRSPIIDQGELSKSTSAPGSPRSSVGDMPIGSLGTDFMCPQGTRRHSVAKVELDEPHSPSKSGRPRSHSPARPASSRHHSSVNRNSYKIRRSGSGSSHSSLSESWYNPRNSTSNLVAMGILPGSKWRFLKHLSLADNSLTTISAASLVPLASTLHSLDLSMNLFAQIPDSLASLTALRALNLSQCMIDSLHSLLRNPLPAITALNIRANRLSSIAGVEKLFPLERLDLRDNRLTDPRELARLTGIPDIREVWVEGNPFTKTHRDYRVIIFNLFRRTPGYTEDIIIDASGPTYSERRQLVERASIPAAAPVVKALVPEIPAVDVSKTRQAVVHNSPKAQSITSKERPILNPAASEVNTNSTRRRRSSKRRIVDLAPSEGATVNLPNSKLEVNAANTSPSTCESDYCITRSENVQKSAYNPSDGEPSTVTVEHADVPRVDSGVESPMLVQSNPETASIVWKEGPDWSVSGEMYRQKIEALRHKVGNGYLSVLNEESWEPSRTPPLGDYDYSPASARIPGASAAPRAISTQPIHSGRTLG